MTALAARRWIEANRALVQAPPGTVWRELATGEFRCEVEGETCCPAGVAILRYCGEEEEAEDGPQHQPLDLQVPDPEEMSRRLDGLDLAAAQALAVAGDNERNDPRFSVELRKALRRALGEVLPFQP